MRKISWLLYAQTELGPNQLAKRVKPFEGMIQRFYLTIHTNHLNLLYDKVTTQRMLRWILLLEEFHPQVKQISGNKNDAADCLSRNTMEKSLFETVE